MLSFLLGLYQVELLDHVVTMFTILRNIATSEHCGLHSKSNPENYISQAQLGYLSRKRSPFLTELSLLERKKEELFIKTGIFVCSGSFPITNISF